MTTVGILVQTTEPYLDLFFEDGTHWARADDRVYVYSGDAADDTVAEVDAEHFVSASKATAESLDDTPTTADDAEVSP